MRGLYATCDIFERQAQDDGYGAVEDKLVRVASGVQCRFTRMSEEQRTKMVGQGGNVNWRISTEMVSGLAAGKHYAIRRLKENL